MPSLVLTSRLSLLPSPPSPPQVHNGWQTARVYMPDELKARIEKLVLDYNQQMAAGGGAMTGGGGASSTPNGHHQASALTGAPAGTSDPLMHATQEQLLAAAGKGRGRGGL